MGNQCLRIVYYLILTLAVSSCGNSWKNWKTVKNETDYQIRQDPGSDQWIYLKKKRNSTHPNDFQSETGPFNGLPPAEVKQYQWTGPYLDSVFGNKDSLQYLKTTVLSNQHIEQGKEICVIRVINDRGDVIGSYSMEGVCSPARINERDRHQLFFANNGTTTSWLILDYLTGRPSAPQGLKLPTQIVEAAIRELEFIQDKFILIEQKSGQLQIHLLNSEGAPIQDFIIPGEFKASVHNKLDKHLLVTEFNNATFAAIVQLSAPKLIQVNGPDATSGLAGSSTDVQYHLSGGKDRWIYAAFQNGTDQQSIRILDENGSILNTHLLNGQIKATRVMGNQMDRIIWALDRIENTDLVVIDLVTGQLVNILTMPGKYKSILENKDHLSAQVSTDQIGALLKHELPLY